MKYPAKSAIIGRMPRREGDEYKTLFIKMFDVEKPLRTEHFPTEDIEMPNVRKVIFEGKFPFYYLEGNDMVYRFINELDITEDEDHTVTIKCL